jgi:sec-independent protein translocase protein TatA
LYPKLKIMSFVTIPLAIGWPQVVLIAVVILILFGGRKIPELMRGLGSGLKEFKDASKDESSNEEKE